MLTVSDKRQHSIVDIFISPTIAIELPDFKEFVGTLRGLSRSSAED